MYQVVGIRSQRGPWHGKPPAGQAAHTPARYSDLAVHYFVRFVLEEGHTAHRPERDYGYDLILTTYDEQGYVEPGVAYLQFKASETLTRLGNAYVFDVDVRDYILWTLERFPVFLILYDASRSKAYWLDVQRYFQGDPRRLPKEGAKTVRSGCR
jgi:hypothetical protein